MKDNLLVWEEILKNTYPFQFERKRNDKTGKISQKPYLINYNFLIAQDLWQASYKILLLIPLKEFEELNVNMDMIIKNVKIAELNTQRL